MCLKSRFCSEIRVQNCALTISWLTVGNGVTGDQTGPIPSQNEYSALSVLIIVQDAPSLITSLDAPLGHGDAYSR